MVEGQLTGWFSPPRTPALLPLLSVERYTGHHIVGWHRQDGWGAAWQRLAGTHWASFAGRPPASRSRGHGIHILCSAKNMRAHSVILPGPHLHTGVSSYSSYKCILGASSVLGSGGQHSVHILREIIVKEREGQMKRELSCGVAALGVGYRQQWVLFLCEISYFAVSCK